jgi:hypothetical protein
MLRQRVRQFGGGEERVTAGGAPRPDQDAGGARQRAHNMIGTALTFGIGVMVLILVMIVVGLFVNYVPTSGAYQSQIQTTIDVGGAGFIITAVVLLFVPVGGLVAYLY